MRPYYRICPECGAHLDPGEICDCIKDAALRAGTSESGGRTFTYGQYRPLRKDLSSERINQNQHA